MEHTGILKYRWNTLEYSNTDGTYWSIKLLNELSTECFPPTTVTIPTIEMQGVLMKVDGAEVRNEAYIENG